jgi:hypothetical protein
MPYRDEHGHFISREEAERRGLIPGVEAGTVEETEPEEDTIVSDVFGEAAREGNTVPVDVGRGQVINVRVGSPFVATLEELAERANYGGFFRIYLNGSEIPEPSDAPATIESGMRIAITSYDKVG